VGDLAVEEGEEKVEEEEEKVEEGKEEDAADPTGGAMEAEEELSVVEWVNLLRTMPRAAAERIRLRLAGCFDGSTFRPPWSGGHAEYTSEGEEALNSLLALLEEIEPMQPVALVDAVSGAAEHLTTEICSRLDAGGATPRTSERTSLHDRLKQRGVWSGVAGEGVVMGVTQAEAIVLKMAISDGDARRKNRKFLFTPELAIAGVACNTSASGKTVAVLALVQQFAPLLPRDVTVEQHGMVAQRDRHAGPGGSVTFAEVLGAIPSKEARDLVLDQLVASNKVRIEYKAAGSVRIQVTDGKGKRSVTRLRWDSIER